MSKRGGARKGSGPKPKSRKYSDAIKTDVFNALKKKAANEDKTFGDVLADLAFDAKTKDYGTRAVALKMIQDILVIKETRNESDIDIRTNIGPTIGLPPVMERPKEFRKPPKPEDQEEQVVH